MANKSIWIYVDDRTKQRVKVFDSFEVAQVWLLANDPDGIAVRYPISSWPASFREKSPLSDNEIVVAAITRVREIVAEELQHSGRRGPHSFLTFSMY